jgi:anti-sigma factor RsiW
MRPQGPANEFDGADVRRITCREFVERVTSYLDSDLPDPERRHFEAHAYYCSGCGTYLRQMVLTIDAIQETAPDDISRAEAAATEDPDATYSIPERDHNEQASLDELLRAFRSSKPFPRDDRGQGGPS